MSTGRSFRRCTRILLCFCLKTVRNAKEGDTWMSSTRQRRHQHWSQKNRLFQECNRLQGVLLMQLFHEAGPFGHKLCSQTTPRCSQAQTTWTSTLMNNPSANLSMRAEWKFFAVSSALLQITRQDWVVQLLVLSGIISTFVNTHESSTTLCNFVHGHYEPPPFVSFCENATVAEITACADCRGATFLQFDQYNIIFLALAFSCISVIAIRDVALHLVRHEKWFIDIPIFILYVGTVAFACYHIRLYLVGYSCTSLRPEYTCVHVMDSFAGRLKFSALLVVVIAKLFVHMVHLVFSLLPSHRRALLAPFDFEQVLFTACTSDWLKSSPRKAACRSRSSSPDRARTPSNAELLSITIFSCPSTR